MSRIVTRNRLAFPAGRKPGFDPTHVASKGKVLVSAVCTKRGFINILSGVPATGATIDCKIHGGLNYIGGEEEHISADTASSGSQLTLAATVSFINGLESSAISTGNSTGNGTRLERSGTLNLTNSNSALIDSGISIPLNVPYFVAASHLAGSVVNFAATNLLTGQIQTASVFTTSSPQLTGIGAYIAFNPSWAAVANPSHGMYSLGFLSVKELAQWANDPWSFWYPDNA